MKGLHLDIVSPEKEIFTGEVDSVTLPGTLGSFERRPEAVKVKPSFILVHFHITLYHCTFRVEL